MNGVYIAKERKITLCCMEKDNETMMNKWTGRSIGVAGLLWSCLWLQESFFIIVSSVILIAIWIATSIRPPIGLSHPSLRRWKKSSGVTTSEEQLRLWVLGNPQHNTARDECCPDFSCCRPELLAPERDRKRFAQARAEGDDKMEQRFLMRWLGRSISTYAPEKKIYIAGDPDLEQ